MDRVLGVVTHVHKYAYAPIDIVIYTCTFIHLNTNNIAFKKIEISCLKFEVLKKLAMHLHQFMYVLYVSSISILLSKNKNKNWRTDESPSLNCKNHIFFICTIFDLKPQILTTITHNISTHIIYHNILTTHIFREDGKIQKSVYIYKKSIFLKNRHKY